MTSLAAAAATLLVATLLISWSVRGTVNDRIERTLAAEVRLTAEALSNRRPASSGELDAEADALGRLSSARVTFIARDGTVVGDSGIAIAELASVENHASRPEVQQALREGFGMARRYSSTLQIDMLYAAVPVQNPAMPELGVVRLALPLTEVREQLAAVRRVALVALGVGTLTALLVSWLSSTLLTRRMEAIAAAAKRYATGDFSRPARDTGSDEIGTIGRFLDDAVGQLAQRASELAADRARMEAILSGMIEGVLVVDHHGRLQLVNDAARRMLRLTGSVDGQHYLELVRHPDIAAQITAALGGGTPDGRELTLPREPGMTFIARSAPVAAGPARGAVLVLHDITDLRHADQIRRDFVANVSHELRTPLTAIRGYLEALMDGVADVRSVPAFSRDHRPSCTPDGAARTRSAAARPSRRRPGDARAGAVPGQCIVRRRRNGCCRCDAVEAADGRYGRSHRMQTSSSEIRQNCTTHCATCSRTPATMRPKAVASSWHHDARVTGLCSP